jgi:hypothetical protein
MIRNIIFRIIVLSSSIFSLSMQANGVFIANNTPIPLKVGYTSNCFEKYYTGDLTVINPGENLERYHAQCTFILLLVLRADTNEVIVAYNGFPTREISGSIFVGPNGNLYPFFISPLILPT